MVKCSPGCTPTCQHCFYAEFEQLSYKDKFFFGEANKCKLKPEELVSAAHYCEDFHCIRTTKYSPLA